MATRWNKHDSVHVATESAHHVLLQTCNGYVAQVVCSSSPSTLRDASLAPNENRGGIIIAYPSYQLRKSVLAACARSMAASHTHSCHRQLAAWSSGMILAQGARGFWVQFPEQPCWHAQIFASPTNAMPRHDVRSVRLFRVWIVPECSVRFRWMNTYNIPNGMPAPPNLHHLL